MRGIFLFAAGILASCNNNSPSENAHVKPITNIVATTVASFAAPWAMVFLPDGRMIVTERETNAYTPGRMSILTLGKNAPALLAGLPPNLGVLDIALDPQFTRTHKIYFSFLEPGASGSPRIGRGISDQEAKPMGLAVGHAKLEQDRNDKPRLTDVSVIWHQTPKIVSFPGSGEPGGRITFSPDGTFLFIAAGDRQEFEAEQHLDNTIGKVVRIYPDGRIPSDNPFVGVRGALPEIWTLGMRNPYGLAFDKSGALWAHENGPEGGDKLSQIVRGANYGWPKVSYGNHYSGEKIVKPFFGDIYQPAVKWWTPSIAPSGMIFCRGEMFAAWKDDALITGLASMALIRVHFDWNKAREVQRIAMGARMRAIQEGPDGAIWVLEDAPTGRLLRLKPA